LTKHTKSVLWGLAVRLSYIQDAWCLKVKRCLYRSHDSICIQDKWFEMHFQLHVYRTVLLVIGCQNRLSYCWRIRLSFPGVRIKSPGRTWIVRFPFPWVEQMFIM